MQFVNKAFSEGQSLAFNYAEKKLLSITVKSIEGTVQCALVIACPRGYKTFSILNSTEH